MRPRLPTCVLPVLVVPALLWLAACGSGSEPVDGEPPVVRILLAHFEDQDAVDLAAGGAWSLRDAETGEEQESGEDLSRRVAVRSARLPRPLLLVAANNRLTIGGRRYLGRLLLTPHETGTQLILATDLESYLPGVVAGEMSARFHPAALRAQAVMARTYARSRMRQRGEDSPWHLADDTRDQMFVGVPADPIFAAAVEHTRGMILTSGADPLPGYYHSTCGGHTASSAEVFGDPENPSLVGVPCGYCSISPRFRWEPAIRFPLAWVAERIGLSAPPGAVEIVKRRRDGRADRIRFGGTPPVEKTGEKVRLRLGVAKLRSTLIHRIEIEGEEVIFRGGGSGHGVGMCQWGAEGMARAGASAADILTHYAPGAVLGRIY